MCIKYSNEKDKFLFISDIRTVGKESKLENGLDYEDVI